MCRPIRRPRAGSDLAQGIRAVGTRVHHLGEDPINHQRTPRSTPWVTCVLATIVLKHEIIFHEIYIYIYIYVPKNKKHLSAKGRSHIPYRVEFRGRETSRGSARDVPRGGELLASSSPVPAGTYTIQVMHVYIIIITNNRPYIYIFRVLDRGERIYTERCVKPAVKVMLAMHGT